MSNKPSHVNLFLNYLNSKDPSNKYDCETQQNQLPYLYISIATDNRGFHKSIYNHYWPKPVMVDLHIY